MKRLISLLMACVFLMGILPVSALAQEDPLPSEEHLSTDAATETEQIPAEEGAVPAEELLQGQALVQQLLDARQPSLEIPQSKPALLPSGEVAQDIGDHNYFEVEPNNTIDQAYPVYSDSTISANLAVNDLDYYKYTLKASSSIEFLIASTKSTLMIAFLDEFGEITDAFAVDYLDTDGLYYAYITGEEIAGTHYIVFVDENLSYVEYAFYAYFKEIPCDHTTYTTKVTAPTCTAQGYTTYTCKSCGHQWKDNYTPMKAHSYKEAVTKPTCISKGYTTYTCKVCGYDYKDNYTKMTDHSWNGGVVLQEPSGTNPGKRLFTCTTIGCNKTYTEDFYYADVVRIAGENRTETARKAADALKDTLGISRFSAILYTNGKNFADALAGSYLAAQKDAPILLYSASAAAENLRYIQNNLLPGGTVYILGGSAAVPESAETQLAAAGISVKRIYGNGRFLTNINILKECGFSGGTILVCTSHNFADSLSASATGLPVMLVRDNWTSLSQDYVNYLSSLESGCNFCIIGGTAAVSAELEEDLKNFGTVQRICGKNRYLTSVMVAEHFFPTATQAVLAYSRNFPDGLCGGPLAYAMGAPLILTATKSESAASQYTTARKISSGAVLGGTPLISDDAARTIFGLSADYELRTYGS